MSSRRHGGRHPGGGAGVHGGGGVRDRGSSTVEFVIVMPTLLIVLWVILQLALWQHARHVALAAAQDGARAARAYDSTAGAGQTRANQTLDRLAPTILSSRRVQVARSTTTVVVQVSGSAVSVIPWLRLTVDERSAGPVERFVPAP